MSDSVVIERIDAFCDVVPRERTRAETFGSLVLFVPVGSGFPYYARPGLGARRPVTAADVRAVRARQRELLIPESFEWIERTAPEMASAATEAGLVVHAHPLLALGSLAPAPRVPELVDVRIVSPEDPDLILAWAVPGVAFGHPGTDIGEAGVTERDKIAANHDAATIEMLRSRLRSRRSVLATASGPNGPLAAGSYQLAEGTAEITGIGVLPASRRRGLAAAVTRALAADALARGARTVFLSATDAAVARIYARLGFREIGTSLIAELPEDLLVRGGAKQRTISASCPRIDSFAEGRSNGPFTPLVNFSPSGRGGLSAARTTDGLILTPARGGRGPGWRG